MSTLYKVNPSDDFNKSSLLSDFFLPCVDLKIDAFPRVYFHFIRFKITSYLDCLFEQFRVPLPDSLKKGVNKRKAEYLAGRWCAQRALEKLGTSEILGMPGMPRLPRLEDALISADSRR